MRCGIILTLSSGYDRRTLEGGACKPDSLVSISRLWPVTECGALTVLCDLDMGLLVKLVSRESSASTS